MPHTTEQARKYSREHAERFRHELHELIRIPSLSADPAHDDDVKRAAHWLAEHLHAMGVDNASVLPTAGHPVVYAELPRAQHAFDIFGSARAAHTAVAVEQFLAEVYVRDRAGVSRDGRRVG